MMKRLLLFLNLLVATAGLAQPFSIDRHTMAGGDLSTGGVYSVSGTVGKTESGRMSGGSFTVDGAFWGITAVVQTPSAPLLRITLTDTNVIVSWPSPSTGYVLQHNSVIGTTNWTDFDGTVADDGTTKRVTKPAVSGNLFFRLRK